MSDPSNEATGVLAEARALMRIGGPAIGAQLAQISMGVVDTIMAGQLGSESLAAVSVGGSAWMPLVISGMGVLMSISPSVAQSYGAERRLECGQHLRQGLWLSLAVATVLFVGLQYASHIMLAFGVEAKLISQASAFLCAVSYGMPGLMAFVALRGFCEGVGTTRPILVISLVGTVANILGNYVFMYGHLGFPAMGATGCGVATAVAEWVMAACLALWILRTRHYHQFEPFFRFEPPRLHALWHLVQIGIPIAISLFMEVSCFAFAGLLIGRFGAEVVSGHQIALNLASLTFMVPLGISIAICVRVGHFIGSGEPAKARWAGTVGAGMCASFMLLSATALATVPQFFVGLYTKDPGVHVVGAQLIWLAGIFQLFDGLQVAAAGALRGLKDTRVTMVITAVGYWGLGFPLGVWLGLYRGWGASGFWTAFSVALAFAAFFLNARFQYAVARRIEKPAPIVVESPRPMEVV
ncbi:MAG: MATE family efflux transporter [Planctomycetota bacterium]|nr:MATE family efflux transporter [Planctomycetota bacterium]